MENTKIKVVISDDHAIVAHGIKDSLELQSNIDVVATASTISDTVNAIEKHQPDILVQDIMLGNTSMLEFIEEVKSNTPDIRILCMSGQNDFFAREVFRVGADGFLSKASDVHAYYEAISFLTNNPGEFWVAKRIRNTIQSSDTVIAGAELTSTEMSILKNIDQPNDIIAINMLISERTIRNYISKIYAKIDVTNRQEAVVFAKEHGILL